MFLSLVSFFCFCFFIPFLLISFFKFLLSLLYLLIPLLFHDLGHSVFPYPYNFALITLMEPSMEPLFTPHYNNEAEPLQRLDLNAPWELELYWALKSPPRRLPPSATRRSSASLGAGSIKQAWLAGRMLFSMQLDLLGQYPPWESELLLALFHQFRSISIGYSLSTKDDCTWIHFDSRPAAAQAIQEQNNLFDLFQGEAGAFLDPNAAEVSRWYPVANKVQALPFMWAQRHHSEELIAASEAPVPSSPDYQNDWEVFSRFFPNTH